VNRCNSRGRDRAPAALEVAGQHACGEDLDSFAPAWDPADQVCAAEDKQGLDLESRHALDQFGFGIRLLEMRSIDRVHGYSAAVAFRLDREDAAWADHDVIDIASLDEHVMDRQPAMFDETVEDCSNLLFSPGTAVEAVDVWQDPTVHDGEEGDRDCLADNEQWVVRSERQTEERYGNEDRDDREQRSPRQAAGPAPRVLPSPSRTDGGFDRLGGHEACIGNPAEMLKSGVLQVS
jgi:hypothetical protein